MERSGNALSTLREPDENRNRKKKKLTLTEAQATERAPTTNP